MPENPFPLEIEEKEDSWSKLQLLSNVASTFKYTAEEFNTMLQALDYLYEVLGGGNGVQTPPIQDPEYATPAAMIANQSNQTEGFLQYVLNATTDPNVPNDADPIFRYYEYLGTTNGDLSDYRLLSAAETQQVTNSIPFNEATIKEIGVDSVGDPGNGAVWIQTSGGQAREIVFDATFNGFFEQKAEDTTNSTFDLWFWNKRLRKLRYGEIESYTWLNVPTEDHRKLLVKPGIDEVFFGNGDKILFGFYERGSSGSSGGTSSPSHTHNFVVADWVNSEIVITAATHGKGTTPNWEIYDQSGDVLIGIQNANRAANGDITLTVNPGDEFIGSITIDGGGSSGGASSEVDIDPDDVFTDIADLLLNNGAHLEGEFYEVTDASTDTNIINGWAIYKKLSATTGAITDYRLIVAENPSNYLTSPTESISGTNLPLDDTMKWKIANYDPPTILPSTADVFNVSVIKRGGGVINYIDTTEKTDFPIINNPFGTKKQTSSNDFRADAIFKMVVLAVTNTEIEFGFIDIFKNNTPMTGLPAPSIIEIEPISLLPSVQQLLTIYSDHLTQNTTVVIEGQTVDSINYGFDINKAKKIDCLVTPGAPEGDFNITLNNGTETIFSDKLIISQGIVFQPNANNWETTIEPIDLSMSGEAKVKTLGTEGSAVWSQELDFTKDWVLEFYLAKSALGYNDPLNGTNYFLQLQNVSDDAYQVRFRTQYFGASNNIVWVKSSTPSDIDTTIVNENSGTSQEDAFDNVALLKFELKHTAGVLTIDVDGVQEDVLTQTLTENQKVKFTVKEFEMVGVKLIVLS